MLFLLFAVVASAVGIAVVVLRHRRPTSMEHSIAEFERGLLALAPGTGAPAETGAGDGSGRDGSGRSGGSEGSGASGGSEPADEEESRPA